MGNSIVPIQDILRYVPHRPPMVWIDKVKSWSSQDGECEIHIKSDAHYMGPKGLRNTSCLEFIAQSYGYSHTCHIVHDLDPQSNGMSKAYLASFNSVEFAAPEVFAAIKDGDVLNVRVHNARKIGPITAFKGEVIWRNQVICSAKMKVFCE